METKASDNNVMGTDTLLPPRKRLLAGLKRHNSDAVYPRVHSTPDNPNNDHNRRVWSLLKSRFSNSTLSDEQLVESSQHAAVEAAKHAEAARSIAEQKAAVAAKAMEAAKRALDLLATLTEESAKKEQSLIKKGTKKNMPPETLYGKRKGKTNHKKDNALAHKLDQPTNSSPRITKSSSVSDAKAQKQKRLKSSDSPGLNNGTPMIKGNASKEHCEKEKIHTTEAEKGDRNELVESSESLGRKRGRVKQRKLALSVCSFKDQTEEAIDEKKIRDTSHSESQLGTLTTVC